MANGLQSLWPEDIENTEVLTPRAILMFQAQELSKKTKNRLRAEINSRNEGSHVSHSFNIFAPQIDYQFRLFRVRHGNDLVYPATLYADCFPFDRETEEFLAEASTEAEFVTRVMQVLQSDTARSTVQSLLARINDVTSQKNS